MPAVRRSGSHRKGYNMIEAFEGICRERNICDFSMGGGNAKGIFMLVPWSRAVPNGTHIDVRGRAVSLSYPVYGKRIRRQKR